MHADTEPHLRVLERLKYGPKKGGDFGHLPLLMFRTN